MVDILFTDDTKCRHTTPKPTVVQGLEHEHIVQVAAGGWHCLAVTKSGSIYAWGGNEYFQCGVEAGIFHLETVSSDWSFQPP
jgi:alpha-tubulin suppressor-like RCC1 family protein